MGGTGHKIKSNDFLILRRTPGENCGAEDVHMACARGIAPGSRTTSGLCAKRDLATGIGPLFPHVEQPL